MNSSFGYDQLLDSSFDITFSQSANLRGSKAVVDEAEYKRIPELRRLGLDAVCLKIFPDGSFCARPNPIAYKLLVTTKGSGWVLVNGKWQECMPGEAYLTPIGKPHAYFSKDSAEWEYVMVRIHDEGLGRKLVPFNAPTLLKVKYRSLECLVNGFLASVRESQDANRIQAWLQLLLQEFKRSCSSQGGDSIIHDAWERVSKKLAYNWRLNEIAAIAGVNREIFRRKCIEIFGRSPIDHLIHLRMVAAAQLITLSMESIESIAFKVGYTDYCSFSRAFKRVMNFTPSEYRNQQYKLTV